jgi:hypothetical protein
MEKDWVLAYSTNQLYQAEILRNVMNDHDIESIIINKQDSAYKFGDVEIYVKRDHILKAKQLVQEFES